MDRELCFCIEQNDLFLEQVLVDYMDVPIFFLCRDDKQYYVVLCTDIDEFKYIIVRASNLDVYNLLHAKNSMRNIFLKQDEYWKVISGDEICSDIVEKYPVSQIDISVLPEEDAVFNILTEEIKSYVKNFDEEFFNDKYFCLSEKKADFTYILMNYMTDVLESQIERFIKLGNFSYDSKYNYKYELESDSTCKYISKLEKQIMLQTDYETENWKNDDIINVAA
jgi:hypothetical protein